MIIGHSVPANTDVLCPCFCLERLDIVRGTWRHADLSLERSKLGNIVLYKVSKAIEERRRGMGARRGRRGEGGWLHAVVG